MSLSHTVNWVQGFYFLLTGVWPLFSMRSFERVTGPKHDKWLVRTVGLLIAVIGFVLLFAAATGQPSGQTVLLGMLSAAAMMAVDIFAYLFKVVGPIYLADAVLELLILVAWAASAVV